MGNHKTITVQQRKQVIRHNDNGQYKYTITKETTQKRYNVYSEWVSVVMSNRIVPLFFLSAILHRFSNHFGRVHISMHVHNGFFFSIIADGVILDLVLVGSNVEASLNAITFIFAASGLFKCLSVTPCFLWCVFFIARPITVKG